ncbi:hypothetical protein MKEN_00221700 [Mycena kentingensis (nom. inval.)]|nr:hypothetical protein MKEN_00221700 [Mycena kentingensis (nom. inval.)]
MLRTAYPQELYDAFIDAIAGDRKALLACARASRLLAPRAQTHLFKTFTVTNTPTAVLFLRSVLESPHLMRYLFTLEFGACSAATLGRWADAPWGYATHLGAIRLLLCESGTGGGIAPRVETIPTLCRILRLAGVQQLTLQGVEGAPSWTSRDIAALVLSAPTIATLTIKNLAPPPPPSDVGRFDLIPASDGSRLEHVALEATGESIFDVFSGLTLEALRIFSYDGLNPGRKHCRFVTQRGAKIEKLRILPPDGRLDSSWPDTGAVVDSKEINSYQGLNLRSFPCLRSLHGRWNKYFVDLLATVPTDSWITEVVVSVYASTVRELRSGGADGDAGYDSDTNSLPSLSIASDAGSDFDDRAPPGASTIEKIVLTRLQATATLIVRVANTEFILDPRHPERSKRWEERGRNEILQLLQGNTGFPELHARGLLCIESETLRRSGGNKSHQFNLSMLP